MKQAAKSRDCFECGSQLVSRNPPENVKDNNTAATRHRRVTRGKFSAEVTYEMFT